MLKVLVNTFITLVLVYLALALLLYTFQRSLIYFPTADVKHNFVQIKIESPVGFINVITLNSGKDKALLYFGGNAESIAGTAQELNESGLDEHSLYLVNYPGYAGSEGKPSEQAFYQVADTVFQYVLQNHEQVSVMGRSIGTGVATYLAANQTVDKLILVTPFDSVEQVAQRAYPLFPVGLLLKDKFNSVSRAERITSPVLIMTAGKDQIIPAHHAEELASKLCCHKIIQFADADHNDISTQSGYYQKIKDFLEQIGSGQN